MKLEVDITRQDYFHFNLYHFSKTSLVKTTLIGLANLLILQFLLNKDKSSLNSEAVIGSSLIYIAIFSGFIYYSLTKSRTLPKDDGSLLGKKTYEFTDQHISYNDKDSEGRFMWSAIKNVGESNKGLYLFLDTNMAIVIPKRCFIDKTEERKFHNYVQNNIKIT